MDKAESILRNCLISKNKADLQIERIQDMLSNSYWAQNRTKDVILKSIENSLCFGIYHADVQIGFARVITDFATTYYLCDVIIDKQYRGKGLGKALMNAIVQDELLQPLFGILATKDAHGLYEQYGFSKGGERFMGRQTSDP